MQKDFDRWNELKKKIEFGKNNPDRFPKEGEAWVSYLGKNIGFEQNGKGNDFYRPVLIIKKIQQPHVLVRTLVNKTKRF